MPRQPSARSPLRAPPLSSTGRGDATINFSSGIGAFTAENDVTDYDSGNEFHFEWAVGRGIEKGLLIGIVSYNYRQITGDSGEGAVVGPFKGSVDAIGAGLVYTTLIDTTFLVLNLRHYEMQCGTALGRQYDHPYWHHPVLAEG